MFVCMCKGKSQEMLRSSSSQEPTGSVESAPVSRLRLVVGVLFAITWRLKLKIARRKVVAMKVASSVSKQHVTSVKQTQI